jgi:hypothetical protein
MKSNHSLLVAALLALLPVARVIAADEPAAATETAKPAAPAAPPEFTDEQKQQLKNVDADIQRFEALVAKVDDAKYAAEVKEQIDGFKKRRDTMHTVAFDSGKYDELRFELNSEYQRVAMWLAPLRTPPRAKKG